MSKGRKRKRDDSDSDSKKKKQRATHGMTKREFHALVNTQWKRLIEGKNKDTRPKKAKDSNEPSVTSIESSNSEE